MKDCMFDHAQQRWKIYNETKYHERREGSENSSVGTESRVAHWSPHPAPKYTEVLGLCSRGQNFMLFKVLWEKKLPLTFSITSNVHILVKEMKWCFMINFRNRKIKRCRERLISSLFFLLSNNFLLQIEYCEIILKRKEKMLHLVSVNIESISQILLTTEWRSTSIYLLQKRWREEWGLPAFGLVSSQGTYVFEGWYHRH